MQWLTSSYSVRRTCLLLAVVGAFTVLAGCQEANLAIDFILGRDSASFFATAPVSSPTIILAARQTPGDTAPSAPKVNSQTQKLPTIAQAPAERPAAEPPVAQEGKRRGPGQFPPGARPEQVEERRARDVFTAERDPFRPPTEILPTECPPSMPLCRFDHSQLKLVGVMQVADGQFKAMVEDPDGRGYFVIPGTQIGGATVTQVSTRGITLYVHKTKKDVPLPLFKEGRETSEM
jgi:hypothetical protein